MKKLFVLAFLSPLSACASAPWTSLDADPASPASLRAPEDPPPRLVAVLADADPLRAPSGVASEAPAQGGDHAGHHGHHGGHGGGARQGTAAGQTSEHTGHGGHTGQGEHAGHGAKQGSAHDGHTGHSGSAPDAGTPASHHGHHQH